MLGVDPGTRKVGLALVEAGSVVPRSLAIVPLEALALRFAELAALGPIDVVAIGRGTNAAVASAAAEAAGLRVELVDEHETTLHARARYFRDHPPRGWRRLVPRGMLLPDRPIDDYAALLIAERFLSSLDGGEESRGRPR